MILRSAIDLVAFKQCQMLCHACLASTRKENLRAQSDSWSWERGKEKETKETMLRMTMLMSERRMKIKKLAILRHRHQA